MGESIRKRSGSIRFLKEGRGPHEGVSTSRRGCLVSIRSSGPVLWAGPPGRPG